MKVYREMGYGRRRTMRRFENAQGEKGNWCSIDQARSRCRLARSILERGREDDFEIPMRILPIRGQFHHISRPFLAPYIPVE
jgi:hypothetical protein